ncbi:MAG: hypothetical protein LQ351_001123 [Letrouitia transgressa]|nr:MAG: hypothetical protein LQ351_001123 [Letrouitia transgressa]
MDMFKLLARSTNLRDGSNASKTTSVKHIPSSADPGPPKQSFSDEATSPAGDTSNRRGRKRKRSETLQIPASQMLREPGISDGGGAESILARSQVDSEAGAVSIEKDHVKKEVPQAAAQTAMSREERRRTLKKHKLKVSLYRDDSSSAKRSTKSHSNLPVSEGKSSTYSKKSHLSFWPQPLISFKDLSVRYQVSKRLAMNLGAQGFRVPTEVQIGALPLLLGSDEDRGLPLNSGEEAQIGHRSCIDLLTIAPTGSGKTLAFMVHLLHELLTDNRGTTPQYGKKRRPHQLRALILAPTHELVCQIANEGKKLAFGTGLKVSSMSKGMKPAWHLTSMESSDKDDSSIDQLEDGNNSSQEYTVKTDVLVSTPLLLLNALSVGRSSTIQLRGVRYLVLDEADVLLDNLFKAQTLGVWNALINPDLQTSLWSATIGSSIESVAQSQIVDRRQKLGLSTNLQSHHVIRLVVGLKDSAVPHVTHQLVYTATEHGKLLALRQLLRPTAGNKATSLSIQPPLLVFLQTIPRAIALYSELLYDIPPEAGGASRIAVLHSNLSDNARSDITARFRKGEIWVLITTDLLSRGVDFRGVNGVVNYDIPNTSGTYVHRVGRTGRQGREGGIAVTFYTKEDIMYVKPVANAVSACQKQRKDISTRDKWIQPWLLDALPNVSKKDKKKLKTGGVDVRRTGSSGKKGERGNPKARISTKSGFERKLESRRKNASSARRRKTAADESLPFGEEWEGIHDRI